MNLIKEYLGHLFNREVGNFLEPDHINTEYFKRDDHNTKTSLLHEQFYLLHPK